MGGQAPAPRRPGYRADRSARIDRANRRRHHDAAPPRGQSSRVRRPSAAHGPDELGTRDHARGAGRAPPAGTGRHLRGSRVTARRSSPPGPLSVPERGNDGGRMWPLLQRYCKLAKVKLIPHGADLYDMKLPLSERAHFSGRASVRVALSLEALERDPDAEMAVLGSPFLGALLEAIRTRAGRLSLGMMPPPHAARRTPHELDLTVPLRDAKARRRKSQLATHTVGRLLARIVLRAGPVVEESVIESAVIDLATGARADAQVTAQFAELVAQRIKPADPDDVPAAVPVPARPPAEMLQLLLGDLREQSVERVAATGG